MVSQNNNISHLSLSTESVSAGKMLYLLPICLLMLGGGLVSCSNVAQVDNNGINVSDRRVNLTQIRNIKPSRNPFSTIYLQGKVTAIAPFLQAGAYQVQDATGKIWVVTNQTLPQVDDTVLIKGKVQFRSIPLAGQELGEVYVQEQEKLSPGTGNS